MKSLHLIAIIILFCACGGGPSDQTTTSTADTPAIAGEIDDSGELSLTEEKDVSGKIISSGYLKDGKKESSWVTYTPTGLVKTVTAYVEGKKEGIFLEFNDNNQVLKKCTYHNDLRHGEYIEYLYTIPKEIRFYQNGKQEGLTQIFYDNGKVMEEGNYKNGLREGVSKWYDQQGNLSIEYEYKNGQLVKK